MPMSNKTTQKIIKKVENSNSRTWDCCTIEPWMESSLCFCCDKEKLTFFARYSDPLIYYMKFSFFNLYISSLSWLAVTHKNMWPGWCFLFLSLYSETNVQNTEMTSNMLIYFVLQWRIPGKVEFNSIIKAILSVWKRWS